MQKGSTVTWAWGEGTASGKVKATYDHRVTRKLKGTDVTRNGSGDNPALLIEQEDGDQVLKLTSEVEAG